MQGGVLPVMKHLPGHGRATADSHHALPVVDATRAELEATDFAPFRALRRPARGNDRARRLHRLRRGCAREHVPARDAGGDPRQHRLRRPADERRHRHEGAVGHGSAEQCAAPCWPRAPTWCLPATAASPKAKPSPASHPSSGATFGSLRARARRIEAPAAVRGRRGGGAARRGFAQPRLNQCNLGVTDSQVIHTRDAAWPMPATARWSCPNSDAGADPVPDPLPEGAADFEAWEAAEDAVGTPEALIVSLDGFEGPLDVLLALARTQKVDLAKISILALADQYLLFIAEARKLRLELAADYLVMAAWLAFLKSKLLLPKETGTDDQPVGRRARRAPRLPPEAARGHAQCGCRPHDPQAARPRRVRARHAGGRAHHPRAAVYRRDLRPAQGLCRAAPPHRQARARRAAANGLVDQGCAAAAGGHRRRS